MTEVEAWSQVASTNSDPSPDGWPEGMARSGVNDSGREMMGSLRRYYDDPQWLNLYSEDGAVYTVTKSTDLIIKLTPVSGTDSTISRYPVGARIRITDGATTLEGFVNATSYSNPDSFITIDFDAAAAVVQAGVNSVEIACVKDILGSAAYSPVGTTTAQEPPEIPSIDDLGDGATLDQGTGNGFDADTVDGKHYTEIIEDATVERAHVGFNSEFMIFQRGNTISNDATNQKVHINSNALYWADRWLGLSGIGATPVNDVVDITRDTVNIPVGFWSAIRLTGATVSGGAGNAERAGIFQILEKRDCAALIDNTSVSFSFQARVNPSSNIGGVRALVLGWANPGTEDSMGSSRDPIANWGSEGAVPTFKTNWNLLLDTGRLTSVDEPWAEFVKEGVDFSLVAGVRNIGILLYIDDSEWTTGDYAVFTGVQLREGATASDYAHTPYGEELARCQRYFQKTQDEDEQPEANQGFAGAVHATANNARRTALNWDFASTMRTTPTINRYNPDVDATTAHNITNDTEAAVTGNEVVTLGTRSVSITDLYSASDANDTIAIHLDADAEL